MHTRQSKRRRLIIRIVVSTVMTISVILLTGILALLMLGYRFNREQGSITQGGLVQFITTPAGAHVTAGAAHLGNVTPSKITLTPGTYPVMIELEGYNSWKKSVTIGAGTVTWLNSARLVPKELTTKTVIEHPSISSLQFFSRAHSVALIQDATKPIVTIDTIDQLTAKSTNIELPSGTYTAGTNHAFSVELWGSSEQYLLLKHIADGRMEWIVVDTTNAARSKTIGAVGGAVPMQVVFDKRNTSAVIALYSDGTLRQFQSQSGELKQYPLGNLASFSFLNDQTILYATKPVKGTISAGYFTLDSNTSRAIRSYQSQSPVYITGARYFSTYYISLGHDQDIRIESADSLPRSDTNEPLKTTLYKSITLPENITSLDTHANGRFVVATYNQTQTVYDIELSQNSLVKLTNLTAPIAKKLEWFDDFNFWSSTGGKIHMYEYDGTNQHELVSATEGMPAVFSDSNKYLYTINKSPTAAQIQATLMIIK